MLRDPLRSVFLRGCPMGRWLLWISAVAVVLGVLFGVEAMKDAKQLDNGNAPGTVAR